MTSSSNANTVEFYNGQVSVGNSNNHNAWRSLYSVIYQCNALLEALAVTETIPAFSKGQLKGEALFLRSFAYSFLVQLYGDVPLLLVTDVKFTSIAPRTEQSKVLEQVVADLLESRQLLPTGYISGERVRANKWAVEALLARIYVLQKKWSDAINSSTAVIQAGDYSLVTNLSSVFIKNSSETILQCWTQNGFAALGTAFIPSGTSVPTYQISSQLYQAFTSNDLRKSNWIKSIANSGNTYYHVYKHRNRATASGGNAEYLMLLRFAEVFLLRAEANLMLGNINEALADVNVIRQRAGLPVLSNLTPSELEVALEKEQRLELFAEWGNRLFMLKRKGTIDLVLHPLKTNWNSNRQYLPIPQYELLNNYQLTQNPGY
ncbi:MAG: RagB/SusD family nutrient uptake outer membrane protein [Chitinophagaceae bacterium]|nr:RagB/SusD family nutrient uptake outer membrane protein [Chitinophagaceae bacterium]